MLIPVYLIQRRGGVGSYQSDLQLYGLQSDAEFLILRARLQGFLLQQVHLRCPAIIHHVYVRLDLGTLGFMLQHLVLSQISRTG